MSMKLVVLGAGDESSLDKVILFVDASMTKRQAESRLVLDDRSTLIPMPSVMAEVLLTDEQANILRDVLDEDFPYLG